VVGGNVLTTGKSGGWTLEARIRTSELVTSTTETISGTMSKVQISLILNLLFIKGDNNPQFTEQFLVWQKALLIVMNFMQGSYYYK
jgi:hypothetical protein